MVWLNIQKSKNLRTHDGVLKTGIFGLCDVYHISMTYHLYSLSVKEQICEQAPYTLQASALSVNGVDVLCLTVKLLAMTCILITDTIKSVSSKRFC